MSASASSLDCVNARRQRMWASGDNAVYQADGSGCPRSTVTAGRAFVEDGGDVHLAPQRGLQPGRAQRDLPRLHGHQGIPRPGDAAEGLPGLSKETR
jgi:hypothetical protein